MLKELVDLLLMPNWKFSAWCMFGEDKVMIFVYLIIVGIPVRYLLIMLYCVFPIKIHIGLLVLPHYCVNVAFRCGSTKRHLRKNFPL